MTQADGVSPGMGDLQRMGGAHFVCTAWQRLSHDQVDRFADAMGSVLSMPLDLGRAGPTHFGNSVAAGLLSLALLGPTSGELLRACGSQTAVSYGFDRVRVLAPLPAGAEWRGRAEIVAVEEIEAAQQIKLLVRIDRRGSDKPVMVGEWLIRM